MTTISRRASLGLDRPTGKRSSAHRAPTLPNIDTRTSFDGDTNTYDDGESAELDVLPSSSPIVPDISIAQRLMIHEQLNRGAEVIEEQNRRISEDESRRQQASITRRKSIPTQWTPRRRKPSAEIALETSPRSHYRTDSGRLSFDSSENAQQGGFQSTLRRSAQRIEATGGRFGRRLKALFGNGDTIYENAVDGTEEHDYRHVQHVDQRGRRRSVLSHAEKASTETQIRDHNLVSAAP